MTELLPDVRSFRLAPEVARPLRAQLPRVAVQTIAAITAEVPAYAEAFTGELGAKIERAVRTALGTFLELVSRSAGPDPGSALGPALEGAYALGRGEARNGRSLDALLAAYRIGARVAWRELAAISVSGGQQAATIAHFAELVFAYIDELSAASAAGHADELATADRARHLHLERLARALLAGDPEHAVLAAAERAGWDAPRTLTAVLLPDRNARSAAHLLDPRTLVLSEAGPDLPHQAVLLVPDAHDAGRPLLLRLLSGRSPVVGPARPWLQVRASLERAVRAHRLVPPAARGVPAGGGGLDTEDHLAALVVSADPEALGDLRAKVLAPLAGERAANAGKLAETLRCWLLHQGRREEVAAELFVHPQTVRYRMSRLRELYGDRLGDPAWVLALTVALAVPRQP